MSLRHLIFVLLVAWTAEVRAETATIAVAANFVETLHALVRDFEATSPHRLRVSVGSTGALYAQVRNGAPFDVMLAADQTRPMRLVEEGYAVQGSRFTYAVGQLVLWSADADFVKELNGELATDLAANPADRIAIANPELAPYGLAAKQAMQALGIWPEVAKRVVMGANVGQAHTMVATGNAKAGFIALSYLRSGDGPVQGSYWKVPSMLHDPILQDGVVLKRGESNDAAKAFVAWLASDAARDTLVRYGYGAAALPDGQDHMRP